MARPRAEIDQGQFEKLCSLMCTETEIADFFGVSVDTVDRWCKRTYGAGFAESYNKKSSKGKIALRRYQLQLAEKNAAMAIFLGKQWLGQKEKENSERANDDVAPVFNFVFKNTSMKGKDE